MYDQNRALELLRLGSGRADANFRDGQEYAIQHIVEGRGRLLVVQKTGWGKSFVYFIATKLLRERGTGPALLISPLLALMRNQIAAAERMGVRAATINSDNVDDWTQVEATLARGEVDILLISPERLANERFRTQVLAGIAAQISMLVIDEAHCISDWGHDFRPHYRLLERIVKTLPPNLRLLATTATANNRVMEDLAAVLGPKLEVYSRAQTWSYSFRPKSEQEAVESAKAIAANPAEFFDLGRATGDPATRESTKALFPGLKLKFVIDTTQGATELASETITVGVGRYLAGQVERGAENLAVLSGFES
jgi:superfamily II DNA helicase RecQ